MSKTLRSIKFPGLSEPYLVPSDQVADHEETLRLFLTELAHSKEENAQRDGIVESQGTRLSAAEANITKLLARTEIEAGTVTLTNSDTFPFNNSQRTVALVKERANQNYIVDYEVTAAVGNVGDIIVSAKLVNGFKIEHTGSATSVTIKYQVLGGMA
mgnify:CR=1 FL=1